MFGRIYSVFEFVSHTHNGAFFFFFFFKWNQHFCFVRWFTMQNDWKSTWTWCSLKIQMKTIFSMHVSTSILVCLNISLNSLFFTPKCGQFLNYTTFSPVFDGFQCCKKVKIDTLSAKQQFKVIEIERGVGSLDALKCDLDLMRVKKNYKFPRQFYAYFLRQFLRTQNQHPIRMD